MFDPATVIDKATYEEPFQYPEGIRAVVVNGQIALRDGERTRVAAGKTLRVGNRARGRATGDGRQLLLRGRSLDDFSALHHEPNTLQVFDVLERIALDRDDVRELPCLDRPDRDRPIRAASPS